MPPCHGGDRGFESPRGRQHPLVARPGVSYPPVTLRLMDPNPRAVVVRGYDRIGQAYLRLVESSGPRVRDKYLAIMREHVPASGRIIELGCGAGTPMTQALVSRYATIALAISGAQLALARLRAPAAQLARADMARLPFTAASADAVAAFYSMTHVPRGEHRRVLAEVHPRAATGRARHSDDGCQRQPRRDRGRLARRTDVLQSLRR